VQHEQQQFELDESARGRHDRRTTIGIAVTRADRIADGIADARS
jgi:hypothetical protein